MPRARFPHSLDDVTRAVDGPFGLVVGDRDDGSIWVLKRERKAPGYTLVHYSDSARSAELAREQIELRRDAINRFSVLIELRESL